MIFRAFQFDASRLSAVFAPRKPRHPVVRVALGLLGVALLAVMVVAGVFVGAAMLLAGLAVRLARGRGKPAPAHRAVVDGEYRVVGKAGLPLAR